MTLLNLLTLLTLLTLMDLMTLMTLMTNDSTDFTDSTDSIDSSDSTDCFARLLAKCLSHQQSNSLDRESAARGQKRVREPKGKVCKPLKVTLTSVSST